MKLFSMYQGILYILREELFIFHLDLVKES